MRLGVLPLASSRSPTDPAEAMVKARAKKAKAKKKAPVKKAKRTKASSSNAKGKGPSTKKAKRKAPRKVAKTRPKPSGAKGRTTHTVKPSSREHPQLAQLLAKLRPGRHAGGTLIVTLRDAHREEMRDWLMGNIDGRVALGRTAFGDILVFRDLRERAKDLGLPEASACDVALIDINYKRMFVLAESVEEFLESLDDVDWQNQHLRRTLYDAARERLGDCADDEVYAFVPALPFGGSEDATSVERANWQVYQEMLFQT